MAPDAAENIAHGVSRGEKVEQISPSGAKESPHPHASDPLPKVLLGPQKSLRSTTINALFHFRGVLWQI